MLERRSLLPKIGRGLLRMPDPIAHGLIVRELDTWLRLEFLGVIARSGVGDALKEPATLDELTDRTGIQDQQLLEALLALGVSFRELRLRRGRYRISGRRLRAIAGSSPDLRGVVEELVVYDNAVYSALESHLRGAPPAPYDADYGDVIAAASRMAEPILGPTVRELAEHVGPRRVLDIGCGSGVYLRHVLEVATAARGVGIDLDSAAVAAATQHLAELRSESRCEVHQGDIEKLAQSVGQFDLVMLMNNVYYWPPNERAGLLRAIGEAVASGGTIVVASATADGPSFNRHLDVVLRVTESSHRLPTADELAADLRDAGYLGISVIEPVPKSGLLVAAGRRA